MKRIWPASLVLSWKKLHTHPQQSLPRIFTLVCIVFWRLAFLSSSWDSVSCVCFCRHVIVARGAERFPERVPCVGIAWRVRGVRMEGCVVFHKISKFTFL